MNNPSFFEVVNDLLVIDKEINDSVKEASELKFTYTVKMNAVPEQDEVIEFDLSQYNNLYDTSRGSPIESLNIKLDGNEIKRFHCAAHKLNLALRHAFDLHYEFTENIQILSKFCSTMRNSNDHKDVYFVKE